MKTDIEYLTAAKEEVAKNAGFVDWNHLKRTFGNRVPDTWNNPSMLLALKKKGDDMRSEVKNNIESIMTKYSKLASSKGGPLKFMYTGNVSGLKKALEILNSL